MCFILDPAQGPGTSGAPKRAPTKGQQNPEAERLGSMLGLKGRSIPATIEAARRALATGDVAGTAPTTSNPSASPREVLPGLPLIRKGGR